MVRLQKAPTTHLPPPTDLLAHRYLRPRACRVHLPIGSSLVKPLPIWNLSLFFCLKDIPLIGPWCSLVALRNRSPTACLRIFWDFWCRGWEMCSPIWADWQLKYQLFCLALYSWISYLDLWRKRDDKWSGEHWFLLMLSREPMTSRNFI